MNGTVQLPIRDTIRSVYAFLWENRNDLFRMIAAPVLVLSIFGAVVAAVTPELPAPAEAPTTQADAPEIRQIRINPSAMVLFAASMMFYVMFAVAWHRRFLQSAEQPTIWSALRWDARKTRFLVRSLMISLILVAVALPAVIILSIIGGTVAGVSAVSGADQKAVPGLVVLLGTLALAGLVLMVNCRVSLWLPATAVDDKLTLLETWAIGQGNTWQLAAIFILCIAPCVLFFMIIDAIVQAVAIGSGMGDTLTFQLVGALARNFANYIFIAAGVSALSICYRQLRHPPTSPGMPYYM